MTAEDELEYTGRGAHPPLYAWAPDQEHGIGAHMESWEGSSVAVTSQTLVP